ncbi:MAG: helix-turn-helix transcriptional regulator [Bacilli bacterium]|nr:helix-turn-helix transcriptional regulator [Bacilli bacterium]
MTKTSFVNKGINKLLYDKRKELNLSLKEASKKLHISKLSLHLIENGYIAVSKKKQKKFITCYNLSPNFFDNDLGYPVMISEQETKVASKFIRKLTRNKFYIIACATLTLGFLATAISGVVLNINSKNNPTSFYDNNVLVTRDYIINNADDVGILDKSYTINNKTRPFHNDVKVSATVYDNDQKIKNTYYEGSYKELAVVPLIDDKTHLIDFDSRIQYMYGNQYYTSDIKVDLKRFGRVTATFKNNKFEYHLIKMINDKGVETPIENNDPRREVFVDIFERNINKFHDGLVDLFDQKTDLGVSYVDFDNSMIKGCSNLVNNNIQNAVLLLVGIIFSCLFLSLTILAFFKRDPYVEESNDKPKDKPITTKPIEKSKIETKRQVSASLPLNPRFSPFIPGAVLRIASTAMIFAYSIGIYLVFTNFINTDFTKSFDVLVGCKIFVSFLIIAYIILLFVKIDMVQERKDYFLTNYFYFFCGIALYLLVVAIDAISMSDNTITGKVSNIILEIIPGNFLWGFLAFNMIVYLLFYKPISYGNDKKKLLRFRLIAIIPYSYLIISMILGICDSCLKLNMPTWLSFLFFTKSTALIIFAIVFTLFCFFYKKYTIKKYGSESAILYQKGNRYYFIKNIAGSIIVALIGMVEILFLIYCPDNPLGFGKDVLIFIAVPFMLFYHPHHGKRSGKIDWPITIFYGLSYVIGVALILISLISLLVRYI